MFKEDLIPKNMLNGLLGKLKKVGTGIGLIAVIYVIAVFFGAGSGGTGPLSSEQDDYGKMSDAELSAMAVQFDYRDLQRNIDNYKGDIIFVDGTILNTQPNFELVTLCNGGSSTSCDYVFFIKTDNNYLADDKISGYVKVHGLSETAPKTILGTTMPTEFLPMTKDVSLTCSNC